MHLAKKLTKYTVLSVLKTGITTALLASLMLMGVDLFSHFDTYLSNHTSISTALSLTGLYAPEAFLFALGPAFLFAVTYQLSMMNANGETLCLMNAGIGQLRIVTPILVCALLLSLFSFSFNEKLAIPLSNIKTTRTENLSYGLDSSDGNNIALGDLANNYIVFAGAYLDKTQTIYDVSLIETDEEGRFLRRTEANSAIWDENAQSWWFRDFYTYTALENGMDITHETNALNEVLKIEPKMFKESADEISKMSLESGWEYLQKVRSLNADQYAKLGTQYYKRVLSCLTPLIMMIIACCMNYRFRKNVLFLSLLCSLGIAVVYYVVGMITEMLASQGVIAPYMGMIIPFISVVLTSIGFGIFFRRLN